MILTSLEELESLSFLYNENFKIGGSVISNNIFKTNNIFFVKQLMNNEVFFTHAEFIAKYNIQIDFLTYHAVVRTIKQFVELLR